MASTDGKLVYFCTYTIALLPDVQEEDFEKYVVEDVLPNFQLTWRVIGAFRLEHHLLKRKSDGRADRYAWQIQLVELLLSATEDAVFAELDKRVRDRLVSFGIPISRTILQEIAAVRTD
jgi:hypothetical protein